MTKGVWPFLSYFLCFPMTGLKKKRDFSKVFEKGRSRADAYLVLYADGPHLCMENEAGQGTFDNVRETEPSRFGISVSKKVGNSVVRHRIKRRLKEICRLHEEEFPKGYDFVIIARVRAAEADYRRLERSLTGLMKKVIA